MPQALCVGHPKRLSWDSQSMIARAGPSFTKLPWQAVTIKENLIAGNLCLLISSEVSNKFEASKSKELTMVSVWQQSCWGWACDAEWACAEHTRRCAGHPDSRPAHRCHHAAASLWHLFVMRFRTPLILESALWWEWWARRRRVVGQRGQRRPENSLVQSASCPRMRRQLRPSSRSTQSWS